MLIVGMLRDESILSIKSMQEELFALTCVGSFIYWQKLFEDVSENKFDPSVVLMSLNHH